MGQLDRVINDKLPSPRTLVQASRVILEAEDGRKVAFKDLFPNDPDAKTILIFIRHFRCELCQSFLTYLTLSDIITPEVLAANNANLVVIGCGEYKMIKPYKNLMNLPFPVYANPSASLYDILGMGHEKGLHTDITSHYTTGTFLGMVRRSFLKALKLGHFFGRAGVQSQLGGEFIFTRDAEGITCSFVHRMTSIVDHSRSDTLLSAVTQEHPDSTSSADSDSLRSEEEEDEYQDYLSSVASTASSVRRGSHFSYFTARSNERRESMATMLSV